MHGHLRSLSLWVSAFGAGAAGGGAGNRWASDASAHLFGRKGCTCDDIISRPLAQWGHVPAAEHGIGLPLAFAYANFLLRGLEGGNIQRRHFFFARAVCLLNYVLFAKVTHRTVTNGEKKATAYLPMTDFLAGHLDGGHQRFVVDAHCLDSGNHDAVFQDPAGRGDCPSGAPAEE